MKDDREGEQSGLVTIDAGLKCFSLYNAISSGLQCKANWNSERKKWRQIGRVRKPVEIDERYKGASYLTYYSVCAHKRVINFTNKHQFYFVCSYWRLQFAFICTKCNVTFSNGDIACTHTVASAKSHTNRCLLQLPRFYVIFIVNWVCDFKWTWNHK